MIIIGKCLKKVLKLTSPHQQNEIIYMGFGKICLIYRKELAVYIIYHAYQTIGSFINF